MHNSPVKKRSRKLLAGSFFSFFTAVILGLLYMLFEAQWLRVKKEKLALPGLPSSIAGLKILHVSDLHAGSPYPNTRVISKFASRARGLEADIVFFTGDMVDKKKDLEPYLNMLAEIQAPLGKFAVLGNHDHGLKKTVLQDLVGKLTGRHTVKEHELDAAEINKTIELNRRLDSRADIRLLENECTLVEAGDEKIQVCGIDDFQYMLADLEAVSGQIDKQAPLRILLSHSPDVVSQLTGGDFQLVLSGHTHGGQICIPYPNKGKILLSSSGSDYADGTYYFPGMIMNVSRGVGTTLVPFRLLSRPEITLLELASAD